MVLYGYPVGDGHRLLLVVGDVDGGDLQPPLQRLDLLPHLDPELGVQVAQRLVKQQHRGVDHQDSGEGDALLLAPAELRGEPVLHAFELDLVEDV